MDSPTIVVARLDDKELQESIKSMVTSFNQGLNDMKTSADSVVQSINESLKGIKGGSVSAGGVSDDGSTKRAKATTEETAAVEKNIAAREKQIKTIEKSMTLDQGSVAIRKAVAPSGGILEQYDNQLTQLRNRLAEVRKDIDIFNYAIGSGKKTQVSWGQEGLKKANQEAERLMVTIATLEKQRSNLNDILAPQGHAIQNYVNSLTHANPELAKLNMQFRTGQSEMQRQVTETQAATNSTIQYTDALKRQIQTIQSRKDATSTFEAISLMPQGTMEEIAAKGKLLQELIAKVRDTPLMSQTNVKLAEKQMMSLAVQYAQLKREKEAVAATQTTNADAEKKTDDAAKKTLLTLDELKKKEEERKQTIIETGVAAQQQASNILASIKEQQQAADYTQQINGVKDLQSAMREMQRAYNVLPEGDPLKDSLQEKIALTKEAVAVATRYNLTVAGIGGIGGAGGPAPKDTVAAYSAELQRLAGIYRNLTTEERDAAAGRGLKTKYQELARTVESLNKELSRPVSWEAVKNLPTKTLDDIAYKLRQLQAYKGGLNLATQKQEINDVNAAIDSLRRAQLSYMSDGQKLVGVNNALGRSWNYMKNRLAFYFTVGASTQLVKELVKIRSEYEMNERALGILVDSAERGTQIFRELSQMSLVSPYTLIELSSAAKQLTAYDVAAKDVVDTTRRLADMASAVGVPIERLTYALGQIKAYGYLNSRDARMFANAGIPLVKQLADYYTELEGKLVSTADVYDRIKKKAVDYNEVMAVINKMTDEGGKFFDFQAKMADTLKVRLANLTLAWNNMLNDIGAETQGFLTWGIGALRDLFLHWKELDQAIWNTVHVIGLVKAGQFIKLLAAGELAKITGWYALLGKKITDLGIAVGKTVAALATNPMTWVAASIYAVVSLVNHIRSVKEEARKMNEELAKGSKEASESLEKFLNQDASRTARTAARSNKLSDSEAKKTWGLIREEIEKSSAASNVFIDKLMQEEDLNKRITSAFGLADKIWVATSLMSGLNEEAFKVSQDSWMWGAFGEGLAEDIEDYVEKFKSNMKVAQEQGLNEAWAMSYKSIASDKAEAEDEMKKLADDLAVTLNDRLGAKVGDKAILGEAIERMRTAIKNANPQIKGEVAKWFDVKLDELLAERFKGAFDKNTSIQRQFLTVLKRDYSSAFAGLTDNILKEGAKWEEGQMKAIKAAAEALKKETLPEFRSTIDEMLQYMNSKDWRVKIAAVMDVDVMSDLQKEFEERLGVIRAGLDEFKVYKPKSGEELPDYTKRLQGERKRLREENEKYEKDDSDYAKNRKQRNDDEIRAIETILDLFHQEYEEKKKGGGSKKDPVLDALKTEIKLVEQLQGEYDKLTKSSASREEALGTIRGAFGNTIKQLNSQLRGYGLPELTTELITGKDPNKALAHFKQTLQSLVDKGMMSLERSKEVEAVINNLTVSAKTYNLDKITKGLNSELDKLKEEYELAVELDANPELGGLFADWWDVDMEGLPHTAQAYAERATKLVNQYLKDANAGLELPLLTKITNDDLRSLREAVDSDQFNAKWLEIIENAVKASRDVRQKEASEQRTDWENLLQKYSEYEYKKTQIQKTADEERKTLVDKFGTTEQKETYAKIKTQLDAEADPEKKDALRSQLIEIIDSITSGNDTALQIKTAIDTKAVRDLADLDFTEFQKTGTWIVATGDLTGMTNTALRGLINSLEEYKQKAKNLDPKQIRQINRALKSLHSEVRKDNPFGSIADTMEEARLRSNELDEDIRKTEEEIDKLTEKREKNKGLTDEENDSLNKYSKQLKGLKKEQNALNHVSLKTMVGEVTKVTSALSGATSMVGDLADAFGDTATAKAVKDIGTVMDKIGQGAALGGSIGGGWGALAGAVVGLGAGLAQIFAGAENKEITSQVEESERKVRRLQNAYKELEYAIEQAYGTGQITSRQMLIMAKQLELVELRRQERLEKSRKGKNRDEDKLIELRGQIIDLENEIKKLGDDITNDLLGISNVGDAVENLVSSMIDAFKKGEDYMGEYDKTFADMVDNMIMKAIASKVIGDSLQRVWDELDKKIKKKGEEYTKPLTVTGMELNAIQQGLVEGRENFNNWLKVWQSAKARLSVIPMDSNAQEDMAVAEQKMREYALFLQNLTGIEPAFKEKLEKLLSEQKKAMTLTPEDVQEVRTMASEARQEAQAIFEEMMKAYGITYGQDAENQGLSALQQGISQISEETAGSIEAYLNGVSQQCYLHSSLLTQIRDVIIGFDPEVSMGIQSQMLLQLQTQYQLMQSMHSLMSNWTTAAGNGIRVEML